jgi:site-specific DNA-methyltransferase (adenine-specific)
VNRYEPDKMIGRWPANVVLDEEAAAMLDEQSGERGSFLKRDQPGQAGGGGRGILGAFGPRTTTTFADSGGASRFFYTAKASRAEREAGLGSMPDRTLARSGGAQQAEANGETYGAAQSIGLNRVQRVKNLHPTVKPVDLMCWLVRLVTPPGGLVLDPFAGSGTTGMAALRQGFQFVGIEQEAEYAKLARERIAEDAPLFGRAEA